MTNFNTNLRLMMGTDGHYYFIDSGVDEHSPDPDKLYKSGALVFNRVLGVLTHTKCNHTETIGLPGKSALKNNITHRSSTGFKYKRPSSAQVGSRKSITRLNRSKVDPNGSTIKLSRPQTGYKKNE